MDFRSVITTLEELNTVLFEDKGHLDHPEDAIFLGGSQYALKAVDACVKTAQNPKTITIKWDGYPALIFGRGPDGKFTIMDKHMFNKKDGTGRVNYSPQAFFKYDQARGVNREGLYPIIQRIWKGLSEEDRALGYYWGDLLFSQPLQEKNGLYTFRANPGGITYTVDANSTVGKIMTNRVAGIAVHQFIPASAASTDEAQSLEGSIGRLTNSSNVAIVPSAMPIVPKLKLNPTQVTRCQTAIQKYGPSVDRMLQAPSGTKSAFNSNLFTVYINKKIVSGNLNNLVRDFMEYVNTRPMSEAMKAKIIPHIQANKEGIAGAFLIWSEIYKLKMSIVKQLDQASKTGPVKGYLQDGTQTQEGYVSYGFKFVDRMGFSRQNLAARQAQT